MRVSRPRTALEFRISDIGGNDITEWARFQVNVPVQVNLVMDNTIPVIVSSSCSVVVNSRDGYSSNLTATL